MKILFLISQLPYPLDTGAKIRSFNLIKSLSEESSITLLSFGNYDEELWKIENIRRFCRKVELVPRPVCDALPFAVRNLFSEYPYSVDKYYSAKMAERAVALLKNDHFDLIHCDSVQVSRNVLRFRDIPKILTEHNIESQILKRAARQEPGIFKKAYFYLQYFKLRRYEIFACKQFDRIITVSEEDKAFFSRFVAEDKISVVPNGVDTEYFSGASRNDEGDSIVFTGSMDWLPNIDAIRYFCKDILPIIWETKKDLKFYVVGRNAPESIIELGRKDGRVIVTGAVEDVRPYMARAKVFVVPLRIGGGTRLKILEAMAMERAVVSTSIGCEGLEVANKENILIADKADDFAKAVIDLLDDGGLRNRLGESGRKLVERKYDWKTISTGLDHVWKETVNKTSAPILLYHDICGDDFDVNSVPQERKPYILNESDFEKQMRYLREEGYEAIGISDFYNKSASANKDKDIIIAFDDGLASNYEKALPVLRKYGLKAVFFITAGKVGQGDMMNWAEIKELSDSGMEIGSHSLTHAIPTNLTEKELETELKESKRILEENLNIKIDYYSSPTGYYNPALPQMAEKAGYKAVLISRADLNKRPGSFILNKISIKRGYGFEKFASIVKRDAVIFRSLRMRQNTRNRLKHILGYRKYDLVRSMVLGGAK